MQIIAAHQIAYDCVEVIGKSRHREEYVVYFRRGTINGGYQFLPDERYLTTDALPVAVKTAAITAFAERFTPSTNRSQHEHISSNHSRDRNVKSPDPATSRRGLLSGHLPPVGASPRSLRKAAGDHRGVSKKTHRDSSLDKSLKSGISALNM